MNNRICTKHSANLKEYNSKVKTNPDGTPKTYWGHYVTGQGMCFGDEIKAAIPSGNSNSPEAFESSLKAPVSPQKPTITREVIKDTDWDAIARGKVRNSVAVAFIPLIGPMPLNSGIVKVMETWVEWVMSGVKPTNNSEDIKEIDLPSERIKKEQEEINETFRSRAEDPES